MPRIFVEFLDGNNIFACNRCGTHLSSLAELISKAFRGQHGTAFLFHSVVNVISGKAQRKRLTTGMHTICDIFCALCPGEPPVGWKYIAADDQDQKYKEGKYILEEALISHKDWIDD